MTFTHRNDLGNEVTGPHIFQDGNGVEGDTVVPLHPLTFLQAATALQSRAHHSQWGCFGVRRKKPPSKVLSRPAITPRLLITVPINVPGFEGGS